MKFAEKYWHTLRHLYPVQFYGRAWFRLRRPRPDLRPAPDLRKLSGQWRSPVECPISMVDENDFLFLNQQAKIQTATDWNASDKDKLWLYNLHYFDDLNGVDAKGRTDWHKTLIARWIAENPPGQGNGWEPYPLSLRIVNWIKWTLASNALQPDQIDSLAVQIRFLTKRLEWHLLGNHLFANAKALVFAGLFFKGDEAEKWLLKGLEIISRQITEQILADGGHFELSPMYHAIILEDILDMINLAGTFPDLVAGDHLEHWHKAADKMRQWQQVMSHPDGQISFFNDAAFGIAADMAQIERYADQLGRPPLNLLEKDVTHLKSSGYIRVEQDKAVALLDVAKIGPDYLPGHAHADTLSFELSLYDQRLFVNSGTSLYKNSFERLRQRSTAAHNTVELDGENSSEVWGGFRVARRAYPKNLKITKSGNDHIIACRHDGYTRLPDKPCHNRRWHFSDKTLHIRDEIISDKKGRCLNGKAVIRYFLHPDINVNIQDDNNEGFFTLASGDKIKWKVEGGKTVIQDRSWHPEFGRSVASQCLEITMTAPHCTMILRWS